MNQHDNDMGPLPLTKSQLAVITAACSQHHLSRLYVFGSLLRPDDRPGQSDIDLLVEFQPLEPTELVDAYFGLGEQLTGSLGTPVDLVMTTARRNPIVLADIDGGCSMRRDSRVLLMAVVESADAIADAVKGVSFDDYCGLLATDA